MRQDQLKPLPVECTCSNCGARVLTNVKVRCGSLTWFLTGVLGVSVILWPWIWTPSVLDCTKDVQHFCPACDEVLGTYKRCGCC